MLNVAHDEIYRAVRRRALSPYLSLSTIFRPWAELTCVMDFTTLTVVKEFV
jgi:hypothetical protein